MSWVPQTCFQAPAPGIRNKVCSALYKYTNSCLPGLLKTAICCHCLTCLEQQVAWIFTDSPSTPVDWVWGSHLFAGCLDGNSDLRIFTSLAFVTQINLVKHVVVLCVSPGLHHNALDANHFQFKTSSSWSLEWSWKSAVSSRLCLASKAVLPSHFWILLYSFPISASPFATRLQPWRHHEGSQGPCGCRWKCGPNTTSTWPGQVESGRRKSTVPSCGKHFNIVQHSST
jgi:hypothetical protein